MPKLAAAVPISARSGIGGPGQSPGGPTPTGSSPNYWLSKPCIDVSGISVSFGQKKKPICVTVTLLHFKKLQRNSSFMEIMIS